MPAPISITKMHGVMIVELVVTLNSVLNFTVLSYLSGTKVCRQQRREGRAVGPCKKERRCIKITAIDLECLNPECIGESEVIRGQVGNAKVGKRIRSLGIPGKIIGALS